MLEETNLCGLGTRHAGSRRTPHDLLNQSKQTGYQETLKLQAVNITQMISYRAVPQLVPVCQTLPYYRNCSKQHFTGPVTNQATPPWFSL